MGKIHKAAKAGKTAEVQRLLLLRKCGLNDRDKENRTALHLASFYGHPEVVTVLVERKCNIDVCDSNSYTPLMMAVGRQEEECVTILLEHGANPNIMDASGFNALHYAAIRNNVPIARKLLNYNANIDAKNKDGLTPVSLALKYRMEHILEFLTAMKKRMCTVDEQASNKQMVFEDEEKSHKSSQNRNSAQPESPRASEKEQKKLYYRETIPSRSGTSSCATKATTESCSNKSLKIKRVVCLSFLNSEETEGEREAAVRKGKNPDASQWQRDHGNQTYNDRGHKSASEHSEEQTSAWCSDKTCLRSSCPISDEMTFHSETKVKEDRKHRSNVKEESENLCEDVSPKDDDDGSNTLSQQRKSWTTDFQQFPIKGKEENNGSLERAKFKDWSTFRSGPALPMKKGKKNKNKQGTSRESMIPPTFGKYKSLPGVLQVNDAQSLSETLQDEERPRKRASKEKNKVKSQISAVVNDKTTASENSSWDSQLIYPDYKNILLLIEQLRTECKDTDSLSKIWGAVYSSKKIIDLKNFHDELATEKITRMENKISGLQEQLLQVKEVQLQLEEEKLKRENEFCNLRFALKQEEDKRKNENCIYEEIKEELREKERQYNEEVKMKQQLEISITKLDKELKVMRSNFKQVLQEHTDTQRQLSEEQKARTLQDRILANHICKQQEMEMTQKKLSSEVSINHEKANDLLDTNRMLRDEIATLRMEIDTIKNQSQEREKKYFEYMESMKEKNEDFQKAMQQREEMLTQSLLACDEQLSMLRAENTMLNSTLENERQSRRLEADTKAQDSTLAAAACGLDQSQTSESDLEVASESGRDECFHSQDEINSSIHDLNYSSDIPSDQLSIPERKLSGLETKLHRKRDDLGEKNMVLEQVQGDSIQEQCKMKETECVYQKEQRKVNKHVGKKESEEKRLSQLQSDHMPLQLQLYHGHNKVGSRKKAAVNMQGQLHSVTDKIQPITKAQTLMLGERSKEMVKKRDYVQGRVHQYKTKKEQKQLHIHQNQDRKDVDFVKKLRDYLQRLKLDISALKITVRKQAGKIEQLERNLSRTNMELLHMKTSEEKCQNLEEDQKISEQEVINLKRLTEMNTQQLSQIEQYKQEIKEKARKEEVATLKYVNMLLKTREEQQEHLDELREDTNAAKRNDMELRLKEMQSEVFEIKTQHNSVKRELKKYKRLYLKEVERNTSLSSEVNNLHSTRARHEAANSELLELQQNYPGSSRPVGVGPYNSGLHHNSVRRNMPRENLVLPPSYPQSSVANITIHLTEITHKLQSVVAEVHGAAADLQSGLFPPAPPATRPKMSSYQKRNRNIHRF